MRSTYSGSARSPRAARLASSAAQRASAASTPHGLTRRTSHTAAATDIRAPTGPLVPRCVLPPDTHPISPRLGQGRALGIPISGLHAVNLVNRWWQFHDTQLSSWVDAAFQALAIDEERSSFGPTPWTSDPRADQHLEQVCGSPACTATWAVAIPTLRWLRSRCCGWPTARREGPRPRVRGRHRRRPGPSRPAVRTRRVDRISRCRRSGDPRRAGRAPGNTSATAAEARTRPGQQARARAV
jgi:hypothetical protein